MTIAPKRAHRTLAERSAETRALLLDTVVDCLIERGYAGTTTKEIADRTGLTRGAQFHHFANKEALVAAAVEHLYGLRLNEFQLAFERVRGASGMKAAHRAAIELNWSLFNSRFFLAWLELLVASRTDAKLRAKLGELSGRVADAAENLRAQYGVGPREEVELINEFAFCLMAGRVVLTLPFRESGNPLRISDGAILGLLRKCLEFLAQNPRLLRSSLEAGKRARSQ